MNAVQMADGQVAMPITTIEEYEQHRRLGHAIHLNAKENPGTLDAPLRVGGWIPDVGLAPTQDYFERLHYRAVLPQWPAPAKPRGFWAWMQRVFA